MNRLISSSVSKAIYDDNLETLQFLLDVGKRTDVQDNLGWTPLHAAVSKRRLDMVELLASQTVAPLNTRCYEGHTPLYLACHEKCSPRIISALLIAGADPNILSNEDVSPLHVTQDPEIAEILLTFGANINAQDFNKYTPLHCAVEHDNLELVEVLISAGADTSLRECNGLNPYMLTFQDHFSCMEKLLDATEDLNAVAGDGWSCLMLAINSGKIGEALELLNRGADANMVAQNLSPLHLAVMRQEVELFNCLWDKINFKAIKKSYSLPHLMLIHRWYIPERINSFLKVLDNPDAYTTTENYQNFLGFLFRFEMDNKLEVAICEIVSRVLNCSQSIESIEVASFIQNYCNCKYKFQILDLLYLSKKADLDQIKFMQIATEFDPELIPKMLSLSLSTNSSTIFRFLTCISRNDSQVLKLAYYILKFYTPTNHCRSRYLLKLKDLDIYNLETIQYTLRGTATADRILEINKVIEYPITAAEKQTMCDLYDKISGVLAEVRTPSLKELSRNAVRLCLKRRVGKLRHCDSALNRLGLPNDIIDIIKLKQPVNNFM